MAIGFIALPFGLRDVKLRPLTGETAGASVDLPNSRTFSFTESEAFEELRGDDGLVALHGSGPTVSWDLEGGGTSFEAIKTMFGGTIIETGTTPNQIKTLRKLGTDQRPYFQVEGQAISDSGGDFHIVVYRCKADGDLSGTMADGSFMLTGASGRGLPRASDSRAWDFVQNESATAIV